MMINPFYNYIKPVIIISILSLVSCKKSENKVKNDYKFNSDTIRVKSDGPNVGMDAYELIQNKFGEKSVESPDLYVMDHTDVIHVYEDTDTIVGDHFVFTMHLDEDGNKGQFEKNIQRNEIKAYSKSNPQLKGLKDETFLYQWKFKIDSGLSVSVNFTNFFQLKPVNIESSSPMIRLNASKRLLGGEMLEIRHKSNPNEKLFSCIDSTQLSDVVGEWFQVTCKAKFSNAEDGGFFSFDMTSLIDGRKAFSVDKKGIDMWPGEKTEYIRPKWGIVRSLAHKESLRSDEERIRIADISIYKIKENQPFDTADNES